MNQKPVYAKLHKSARLVTLRHMLGCTVATVHTIGGTLGRIVVPGRHYKPNAQLYALMSGPDARFVPSRN